MQCKLRYVNFGRVSDHRRAFRQAFRVTGICDDWYRSTIGVIVISLETPWSTRENFGCTWECLEALTTSLGAPATSLGAPVRSLRVPAICLRVPARSLGVPRITVEQSGKNNICFGNAAGAPGNHSHCISFNNF